MTSAELPTSVVIICPSEKDMNFLGGNTIQPGAVTFHLTLKKKSPYYTGSKNDR